MKRLSGGHYYSSGYVIGFIFTPDLKQVLMVRKNRPKQQVGRLNGVGGKIIAGEIHLSAMIRECLEETGMLIERWQYLDAFRPQGADENVILHIFYTTADLSAARTTTDEQVIIYDRSSKQRLVAGAQQFISECARKLSPQQ